MSISELPPLHVAETFDAALPVEAATPPRALTPLEETLASFYPEKLRADNLDWPVVIWMTAMHLGALAAPFYFTWSGLALFGALYFLTASVGICLGFHRFLSHRSLKLAFPARMFVMGCGTLSGQGSPLFWAATHRLHHMKSDQPGDPHSPFDGNLWSHIWWVFVGRQTLQKQTLLEKFVPDLLKDPVLWFLEKTYGAILIASGVALYAAGHLMYGPEVGVSWLLWGLCARIVFVYHNTWFVNSATHLWGYRNYSTRDDSRNLWWVAVLALGEGWHNNHHAHPNVAPAGHRWWEFDITWQVIKALRLVGLAYDVNDRIPAPNAAAHEEVDLEIAAA